MRITKGMSKNQIIGNKFVKISESEYQTIYQLLKYNNLEQVGKVFINPLIPKVLGELESKRLIQTDNGAKIIRLQGHKYPLIVTKSDGGYTYDTTDLAAILLQNPNRTCRSNYLCNGYKSTIIL